MADILFKCSACSRHLIGNAAVIGTVIACTDCGQQIFVPKSAIWFKCSKCQAELAAPSGLIGEPFHCPSCRERVVVPQQSTATPASRVTAWPKADLLFKCSACSRHLAVSAANVGAVVACKACKQQIIIPKPSIVFKCQKCQAELVAPPSLGGEAFDCPHCQGSFVVPQHNATAPVANGKPVPKTDLLFKCSACASPLDADTSIVGAIVACPSCKQQVIVPKPSITFKCTKCLRELVAPSSLGGDTFECPRCGGTSSVPPAAIRLPQKRPGRS